MTRAYTHGVLFVDEMAEFQGSALQALREPLETGRVTSSASCAAIPFWRLMLVIIGLFWFLTALAYVLGEWVAPAYYSGTAASTKSAFNWGQALSLPLAKAFGLWISGILFALDPMATAPIAIERGLGFGVLKAQGVGDNQRDTRR